MQNVGFLVTRLIYQCGKTFCFLFLRAKFRNWAMLYDETLFELFNTDIVCKKILFMLDSLKCFVEKRAFQNESAFQEIQFKVHVCFKSTSRLSHSIAGF